MSQVKHFPANTLGRDFVVGDIHGCTKEFRALLDVVQFDTTADRVFSVGDLIDRGPDSMGALRLLSEPWFHAVLGNHELMMMDALASSDLDAMYAWIINGGAWHRAHEGDELDALAAELAFLPLAIVVGEGDSRFNVLHAEFIGSDEELSAGKFDESRINQMVWGRTVASHPVSKDVLPKSPTYVGHTIVSAARRYWSYAFIDTGAFLPHISERHGALTMVNAATGDIHQVEGPL